MGRFFIDSDFEAFDGRFGASDNEKIIANRVYVVNNRFKVLHETNLKKFFSKYDLHAHWQAQHLTNVVWPLPQANGGFVDYVRMGYGKPKDLVKLMGNKSGVFSQITERGFSKDQIAFYCVTQLQVALNYEGWEVSLYIDDRAWMEQKNVVMKIKSSDKLRSSFKDLLSRILMEDYTLYIYSEEKGSYYYEDEGAFIEDIINYTDNKVSYTIHIVKEHARDSVHNDESIEKYLEEEFTKLMPLYKFMSWHPQNNNYIGL